MENVVEVTVPVYATTNGREIVEWATVAIPATAGIPRLVVENGQPGVVVGQLGTLFANLEGATFQDAVNLAVKAKFI